MATMTANTSGIKEPTLVQSIVFEVHASQYKEFHEKLWRLVDKLKSMDGVREVKVFAPPLASGGRVNVILVIFWNPSHEENTSLKQIHRLVNELARDTLGVREELYSLPVELTSLGS